MAHVTFWARPGCASNARQIALLRKSGQTLEVRNLGAEPWTNDRLRGFFGATAVADWFNRSAPMIKRKELRPEMLSEAEALALLIRQPLLIRRPLLECDETQTAGFDADFIAGWIGLAQDQPPVGEGCPRRDMPACHTDLEQDDRSKQ